MGVIPSPLHVSKEVSFPGNLAPQGSSPPDLCLTEEAPGQLSGLGYWAACHPPSPDGTELSQHGDDQQRGVTGSPWEVAQRACSAASPSPLPPPLSIAL